MNIEEGEEEEVKTGRRRTTTTATTTSYPDMEDVEEEDAILIAAPKKEKNNEDLLRTRTYDVSITWDLYYQTPRVWLNGYDEQKNSLAPKSVYEDISADHAKKTVTIDPHPHTNVSSASVHPCKHASVMKKLVKMITSGEEENEKLSVERYLVVFEVYAIRDAAIGRFHHERLIIWIQTLFFKYTTFDILISTCASQDIHRTIPNY